VWLHPAFVRPLPVTDGASDAEAADASPEDLAALPPGVGLEVAALIRTGPNRRWLQPEGFLLRRQIPRRNLLACPRRPGVPHGIQKQGTRRRGAGCGAERTWGSPPVAESLNDIHDPASSSGGTNVQTCFIQS
jgi:hypothetical protein